MHRSKSLFIRRALQELVFCGKHLRLVISSGLSRSAYPHWQQALAEQTPSWAAATRGTEASAPPTRAAPINLSALARETSPLASPLASSSKERSLASGVIGYILSPKVRDDQPRPS